MFFGQKKHYEVISDLTARIKATVFSCDKLGGSNLNVQINETMLNFECKSHRVKFATNSTNVVCIVYREIHITKDFACIILD